MCNDRLKHDLAPYLSACGSCYYLYAINTHLQTIMSSKLHI